MLFGLGFGLFQAYSRIAVVELYKDAAFLNVAADVKINRDYLAGDCRGDVRLLVSGEVSGRLKILRYRPNYHLCSFYIHDL